MHKPSTTAACVLTRLALLGITPQPLRSEVAEGTCRDGATAANLNVTLKDINGKSFPLSDYKGKVVLLGTVRAGNCPVVVTTVRKYRDLGETSWEAQ